MQCSVYVNFCRRQIRVIYEFDEKCVEQKEFIQSIFSRQYVLIGSIVMNWEKKYPIIFFKTAPHAPNAFFRVIMYMKQLIILSNG